MLLHPFVKDKQRQSRIRPSSKFGLCSLSENEDTMARAISQWDYIFTQFYSILQHFTG